MLFNWRILNHWRIQWLCQLGRGQQRKKKEAALQFSVRRKESKRKVRKKFHVIDFPLGEGQDSYNLKGGLTNRKANVTFGQLVEMVPKLKRQWKKFVIPLEKEPNSGLVRVLAISEFPGMFPLLDVWHKRKNLKEGYVDGGV